MGTQCADSIDETYGSENITPKQRSREREDGQIRQFYKMFCDLCTSEQFHTFADANSHYRECHDMRGYLVCCNVKIRRRNLLIDHIDKHLYPDMFRYVAAGLAF